MWATVHSHRPQPNADSDEHNLPRAMLSVPASGCIQAGHEQMNNFSNDSILPLDGGFQ
jgi:hypothetical protein